MKENIKSFPVKFADDTKDNKMGKYQGVVSSTDCMAVWAHLNEMCFNTAEHKAVYLVTKSTDSKQRQYNNPGRGIWVMVDNQINISLQRNTLTTAEKKIL